MLVKLGENWVRADRVDFLEKAIITQNTPDGTSNSIETINIVSPDKSILSAGNIDDFAKIINDAIAPQQSWSDESESVSVAPTGMGYTSEPA